MTITHSGMTPEQSRETLNRQVVRNALAAYEATRAANALKAESQSQNSSDGYNGNSRNGNGGNGNGGNGNPNENKRGVGPVARECIHTKNFMSGSTHSSFKGTKEYVGFLEIRELIEANGERFQELTMMCTKMVPEEEDRIEKFIGGLPNNIQGNVIAAEPIKIQDVVHIANNLMDQKLKGFAVKNVENKRSLEANQRDNRGQQPPFKRHNVGGQNVARAYTAGNNEKRRYAGPLPYCSKCKLHHEGPCIVKCGK
ncbi:hypothetical protein Tco_0758769 [Tanacetum coccineum]